MRAFLLLFALLPLAATAQSRLIWGETEIIGLHTIKRQQVLALLPVKTGKPMEQKEKEILGWCNELQKLPIEAVKCSGAVEDGVVHLVVELVERDAPLVSVIPSRAPAAGARISPAARELLIRREYRMQEMAAEGQISSEQITPSGVLVSDDPELRAFDAQLREQAQGQREMFVKMVLDPRHAERVQALSMLAWAGRPEESVSAIHARLLDPDPAIRNATGQFILAVMPRITDPQVAHDVAISFVGQLAIPTHTDRTKAVQGLAELLAAHPELNSLVAKQARAPLEALARDSVLMSVGGQAQALLASLQ